MVLMHVDMLGPVDSLTPVDSSVGNKCEGVCGSRRFHKAEGRSSSHGSAVLVTAVLYISHVGRRVRINLLLKLVVFKCTCVCF